MREARLAAWQLAAAAVVAWSLTASWVAVLHRVSHAVRAKPHGPAGSCHPLWRRLSPLPPLHTAGAEAAFLQPVSAARTQQSGQLNWVVLLREECPRTLLNGWQLLVLPPPRRQPDLRPALLGWDLASLVRLGLLPLLCRREWPGHIAGRQWLCDLRSLRCAPDLPGAAALASPAGLATCKHVM